MSVTVEKLEKSMAKLKITVSAEQLEKAIQKAYDKNKSKIQIPGFRKGKAPRKMIEQMYGKGVFYEDAANELIEEEYPKAIEECGEDVVSSPKIDVEQLEAGKDFIFTAEVALKPPVKLGKYKGVEAPKMDIDVTDADVDAEIDKQRNTNARTVEVTDRAVKDGDIVTLDFEGFVDGKAFQGGKGTDYPLTIGSGAFIPGFEEQLVGFEIGKEGDVNVTFPEDYQADELAGKAATFKCTIKAIKAKELPELNDEFASDVSDFDTLAEYKEDVKNKLVERKTNEEKAKREDLVVKAVIEDSDMELPEAMVETQARQIVNDFAQRLQMQGMSMDQYLQYTGNTVDKMLEQVKPQAVERIQARLVLEAVAEKEKITVSDEEFEEELKKMAEQYRMELSKLKELMSESEQKTMRSDLAVQKAADFLVENVKEVAAKKTAAKKTATKKADEAEEKPAKKTAAKKTTTKKADAEEKPAKKTAAKKTTTKKADAEEKPKKTTTRKKKTEE
ncbi:trigger factor [Butyrivibrio hungatei DSM 14810]|uniref:Trigger factor n=1 Tax=Butyrivibrio hungatei DSM 14810 TaxID=1121132 RepID=A0A1M7RWE6_9FIRM|nr:trigger factor [Butyrivibrio hungatei]SHN50491.1 trigger factor [Butyrivibrio hungatei DSM 14810]